MEQISNFSIFELEPLVVGGQNTAPNSIPYQVNIQFFGKFRCGGSILNSIFILTAAHCLFDNDHELLSTSGLLVLAGDYNINKSEETEQYRSVTEFFIHPEYNDITKLYNDDIAILRLGRPLKFNSAVGPIPFPRHEMNFTGFGKLNGWGQVGYLSESLSNTLQHVTLPIIPKEECQKLITLFNLFYETSLVLLKNDLCAGAFGKGSCFGDSGGPLVCQKEGGSEILCGVVSTSVKCGYQNFLPSVFTDVSKYGHWIEQIISNSRKNNQNHPQIVGNGFNEVERRFLPSSIFNLERLIASNGIQQYFSPNKKNVFNFSLGYIAIISQTFESYYDYSKYYLAEMYPNLQIIINSLSTNTDFVKPVSGNYIRNEYGLFPFAIVKYVGIRKLIKHIAINHLDQSYLSQLKRLPSISLAVNPTCEEKLRWNRFFQKYGTHYILQHIIGKMIKRWIRRKDNYVQTATEAQLRKKWGVVASAPLRPMINESFPFVTEQELDEQEFTSVPTLTPDVEPIYKILEDSADMAENIGKKEDFQELATKFKCALILYRTNKISECRE